MHSMTTFIFAYLLHASANSMHHLAQLSRQLAVVWSSHAQRSVAVRRVAPKQGATRRPATHL